MKIAKATESSGQVNKVYPLTKKKYKYYQCECGTEMKVTSRLDTDWYGILEYMRCKCCQETMVAQNDNLLGIAAR